MIFESIICPAGQKLTDPPTIPPDYFRDLNLDQMFENLSSGHNKSYLEKLFSAPQKDKAVILYRQNIMQDFENSALREIMRIFSISIGDISAAVTELSAALISGKPHESNYLKKGFLLNQYQKYINLVYGLIEDLESESFDSNGLDLFLKYLIDYSRSDFFTSLCRDSNDAHQALASIEYCMMMKGGNVRILPFEGEADYNSDVERLFLKFRQKDVKSPEIKRSHDYYAEHVEAQILDLVRKKSPKPFDHLDQYCKQYINSLDSKIVAFSRDVQFYIRFHDYIGKMRQLNLPFCYPKINDNKKQINCRNGFDIVLAKKLASDDAVVVCNDFYLDESERILIVSGPNQGGKTTFARSIGQQHHLASIGCCVPGSESEMLLTDHIYTHFERKESIQTLHGKLKDDLIRLKGILSNASGQSLIIVNEIFSSTSLNCGITFGKQMLDKILELEATCIWVTFITELADYSHHNVSMTSAILPEDPVRRTHKIVRRHADGLAYATYISQKYGLSYEKLRERISK